MYGQHSQVVVDDQSAAMRWKKGLAFTDLLSSCSEVDVAYYPDVHSDDRLQQYQVNFLVLECRLFSSINCTNQLSSCVDPNPEYPHPEYPSVSPLTIK
jgi:hypothetical protein